MQNKNPLHSLAFISLFFVIIIITIIIIILLLLLLLLLLIIIIIIIIIIITILSNQCVVRACTWTVEISILVKTETLRLESEKRLTV